MVGRPQGVAPFVSRFSAFTSYTGVDSSPQVAWTSPMDARRASLLSRFLSMRYGTAIAVVVLVLTLNSTLLFFSQLLQQSNARLYHHGEGKSYMSINVASDLHEHDQEDADASASPSAVFGGAMKTISAAFDNIAGTNQEHIVNAPVIDIVYTWVNGSDPRQIKCASLPSFHIPFHRSAGILTSNSTPLNSNSP